MPLNWFTHTLGYKPFPFQRRTWQAYREGQSGLIHAPTGTGKTLAAWLGPLMEWAEQHPDRGVWGEMPPEPLRVLWITPLRALAADTTRALQQPVEALGMPWTVQQRTGDVASSIKARQKKRLPTALVTTPESLSLLLSYADAPQRFAGLRCVIVDEWHELLSTKRGTQAELCLARLRAWEPDLRTWGLSATLGNLEEARDVLMGGSRAGQSAALIRGRDPKPIEVETLVPADIERFPWTGHLGLKLVQPVIEALDCPGSALLFTNTRSQAELWFEALLRRRPDWIGQIALHHGSLDRKLRARVEELLRVGLLRCVVCTSSLDLGVDFTPVDRVFQVGSPKGVGRLMQRAGRSGHQPGAVSRVIGVPTHAFELIEFAAARDGIDRKEVESRRPLDRPLDVLVQHLVTAAMGGGFAEQAMLAEVRSTWAFASLSDREWRWAIDFLTHGGEALRAYPEYARLRRDTAGRFHVGSQRVARMHRMAIGTITADAAVAVRFMNGRTLGTVEESFIARMKEGDRFAFAGRVLELIAVRGMVAYVRRADKRSSTVPRWQGSKSPLSTQLAGIVRQRLHLARQGRYDTPELRAVRPLLQLQQAWSHLPGPDELLVEQLKTRQGHHLFVYPFAGRLAHEGLGALLAYRLAQIQPRSVTISMNDYGLELLCDQPIAPDDEQWRGLLDTQHLVEDLLHCLNATELARRQFREIARIAGLVFAGYPGQAKTSRQLQASSELFFDVLSEYEPDNLLIDQARREVLEQQLEIRRLKAAMQQAGRMRLVRTHPPTLTPLAFPLRAEHLRDSHVSTERWSDRIRKMAAELEQEAG